MGKKLDAVRDKSREGGEVFRRSDELSKKAVSDVKQMKHLIDSLPKEVDDEIVEAAYFVSAETKSEAEGYMQSEVGSRVEAGKRVIDASTQAAIEQVKKNEKVRAAFARMDSIGNFGRNARAEGTARINQSNQEFHRVINENAEQERNAEEAYRRDLSDISSTF